MSWRTSVQERDLAGFSRISFNETGAMVVKAPKGKFEPFRVNGEDDVIRELGIPSAQYPDIFEAIAYANVAPLWIVAPYMDDSLFGGVDVLADSVVGFEIGRDFNTFDFNAISTKIEDEVVGTGDDTEVTFTKTLDEVPVIMAENIVIKVDGVAVDLQSDEDGVITGSDGSGTLDLVTGDLSITFNDAPINLVDITIDYVYPQDMSTLISHTFFATSPYKDDLAVKIEHVEDSRFKLELYQKMKRGFSLMNTYNYSLEEEVDNFGRSLYIHDVFRENPYVIPVVNSDFTGTYTITATTVEFKGGYRNSAITSTEINIAWDMMKYPSKYPIVTFIDLHQSAVYLNNIVQNFQEYAHIVTGMPLGTTLAGAKTFRDTLGLDSDNVSLYWNWSFIENPYVADSFAWISNLGNVAANYARAATAFDFSSPAGTLDEEGRGGLLQQWLINKLENDATDNELRELDDVQINPIVRDDLLGVMVFGDRTLIKSLTDTSYIGARRGYNLIIKNIVQQVLRLQEFKLNDPARRLSAKARTEALIQPPFVDGWIRDYKVVCDESNNTNDVLDRREFILDTYIKVMPNSQTVKMRFTRVGQSVNIDLL